MTVQGPYMGVGGVSPPNQRILYAATINRFPNTFLRLTDWAVGVTLFADVLNVVINSFSPTDLYSVDFRVGLDWKTSE